MSCTVCGEDECFLPDECAEVRRNRVTNGWRRRADEECYVPIGNPELRSKLEQRSWDDIVSYCTGVLSVRKQKD